MCHCKTCAGRLHVIIVMIAIAVPYSLASCLIGFPFLHTRNPFTSPRFVCITHSAHDVTLTPARITVITLSRMTRAGSHFVARIWHSLPRKKVKKVEKVKHFRTIHTLRSLPDQGGDVCKVWFILVHKCEFL
jgi:hypothetical protein